jgi:hypothetical protein
MDKRTMAAPLTPKPTRKGVVVGHPFHVLQIAKGICSLFSGCEKKLKLLVVCRGRGEKKTECEQLMGAGLLCGREVHNQYGQKSNNA